MKLPPLAAAIVIFSSISAFAITEADITPAALVGKTLTFTIAETSAAPFATTGTWTGTFAASGNGFSVANNPGGDTVPISTTYSAAVNGTFTDVALAEFLEGKGPATLSLYILEGVPKYEVFINGISANVNGTFTFGSASVKGPEIDVRQTKGGSLTDGSSRIPFGAVQVTKTGAARKFVIKNTGSAPLKNLAFAIDGKNKADFIVSTLKKDQLADGESTGFTVTFKPAGFGTRKATLHIKSNDKNESSFDIDLAGSGTGIK